MHAAEAEIFGMHAAARRTLVKYHQLLALLKAPQRWGERTHVHGLRGHVEQVRKEPADLRVEHADELPSLGHLQLEELLACKAERMLLIHRRHIIETIEIADGLQIGLVLNQLLSTAVKQPDVRIDAVHDLAVELQHQPQHTVRGGMLRAEVDVELANLRLGHLADPSSPLSTRTLPLHWLTPSALGLLIARKHIVHSLPGALEVEGTELLRELDGFIDDALRLVVIAHLDIAREREVLAHWVTLEAVVGEDATQIRVAGEQDAIHVVGLPLIPIGRRKQVNHAWHGRVRVRLALDPKALILARGEQVIDHVEASRAFWIVDATDVDQLLELALAVIAQDRQHLRDVLGLNDEGELAKRQLVAHQLAAQQGLHMLGEVVERAGHSLTLAQSTMNRRAPFVVRDLCGSPPSAT